jgi:hypothetical protein
MVWFYDLGAPMRRTYHPIGEQAAQFQSKFPGKLRGSASGMARHEAASSFAINHIQDSLESNYFP